MPCRGSSLLMLAWWSAAALALSDEAPYGRHEYDETAREHWAFQPVATFEPPTPHDEAWVRTPIDAFVLARLEREGLRPSPRADRARRLRRVFLDLIGLLPTPEEQAAFEADDSPQAWERVVEALLARPEYGERWARHWLDLVRYAETNGYERDGAKPHAWRYRDYVIESLNADKPFDRFCIEQLAGDELPDGNAETQIATTFLRLGVWDDEPADPVVDRYDQLDDLVAATSTAFLGLTLRCARCHDHKYEPLSQRDYTRVLAAFEPLKRPQKDRNDLDRFVGTPAELAAYEQAHSAWTEARDAVQAKLDAGRAAVRERVFASPSAALPAEALGAFQVEPDQRTDEQKKLVLEHQKPLDEAMVAAESESERETRTELEAERARIDAARPVEPRRAYIWYEEGGCEPSHVFRRGNPRDPGEEIAPGLPAILVESPPPPPTAAERTSGRRLALARWIASADNPLTARVIVNRIWQWHFGDGLVGSESDFGVMGQPPTHPELLDWLAARFVAGGWRLKPLHRLIVLSSAYQQAALDEPAAREADAEFDLLWCFPPRRLEAEVVRDTMLQAAGRLNLQRGGPSMYPEIAADVMAGQSKPGDGWGTSTPEQSARRSVYVFVKRTLLVPELEVLDLPSTEQCCEQRSVSTTAPQALTYFNGAFAQAQAAALAEQLEGEPGATPGERIARAFTRVLCRPPRDEETAACAEFLAGEEARQRAAGADDSLAARSALAAFVLVLFNSNEFVYLN